jgi:hypothetical protein
MQERILFDLEGKIREKFKLSTGLGLQGTGDRVSTPASNLPLPPAEPRVEPEATPRTQQTSQTAGRAQTTAANKTALRVDGSPMKNTRNAERFLQ